MSLFFKRYWCILYLIVICFDISILTFVRGIPWQFSNDIWYENKSWKRSMFVVSMTWNHYQSIDWVTFPSSKSNVNFHVVEMKLFQYSKVVSHTATYVPIISLEIDWTPDCDISYTTRYSIVYGDASFHFGFSRSLRFEFIYIYDRFILYVYDFSIA